MSERLCGLTSYHLHEMSRRTRTTVISESSSAVLQHRLPTPLVWLLLVKEVALLVGTLVHELAHYLAALVLDLDIYDWSFLDPNSRSSGGS